MLDAASTTSTTITATTPKSLDSLLLSTIGFAHSGIELLGPSKKQPDQRDQLRSTDHQPAHEVQPATDLHVGRSEDGYWTTVITTCRAARTAIRRSWTSALLMGDDPYKYPDNLPVVGAKGGPGGKSGCGSLPDVAKNFAGAIPGYQYRMGYRHGSAAQSRHRASDLRKLSTGHPGGSGATEHPARRTASTRADPVSRCPPYGAPVYGPDGTPLYPGLPPAPPQGRPGILAPRQVQSPS